MPTISFVTLGCKLNYAETSTYERALTRAGFTAVPWTGGADIFLVNTCSVTEHSDKKGRNIIRKLHRISPEAAIYVTGCYAQLKPEEISRLEGVARVFGANEKSKVVPAILSDAGFTVPEIKHSNFYPAFSTGERTRSFLKVQDGCDFKCAYCTVPYARGESRNIPIADIILQAEAIAASGIKEIVLTGVNTGDFGRSTGESFLALIQELNKVEGIERYRISSIEPNLLTEEIIDWIAGGSKFLPHFHIPLQSGSDEILRQMGRRYTTNDFAGKIAYIRNAMEGPCKSSVFFGIDVIVGFPGETDELFMETYNFLKNVIRPAFIHVFPYSRRAGTPASERKDQIQECKKTERVALLESLSNELHENFVASQKGIHERVLFESRDKNGNMEGYTGNYIRVSRPYSEDAIGRITEIVL